MNLNERIVLDKLRNYTLLVEDIRHIEDSISEQVYRVTASYSLARVSGGQPGSAVEDYVLRQTETQGKLHAKVREAEMLQDGVLNAQLTKREREILYHFMGGGSLSSFAREHKIYKSHVYKIRDAAVRKVTTYLLEHGMKF